MFIMQMLGDPAGWKYALRSILCFGLLLYLKPWQYYIPLRVRNIPLALGVGVAVFLGWIFFETNWMERWPGIQNAYRTLAILPPWRITELCSNESYAPRFCGWIFTTTRVLGSAFVIAIIEEYFWRGFIYRWMFGPDFLDVDLGAWNWKHFILVAMLFGLEHHRWLVGFAAGIAYGWLMIRTQDIWAASLAHAVTNLMLGIYVVWAGQYEFWS